MDVDVRPAAEEAGDTGAPTVEELAATPTGDASPTAEPAAAESVADQLPATPFTRPGEPEATHLRTGHPVTVVVLGAHAAESAALAEEPTHDDAETAMKRLVLRLPAAHRAALDQLRERLWNESWQLFSRADLMRFFVACGLSAIDLEHPVALQLSVPDLKRARAWSPRPRRRRPKRGGPSMRARILQRMADRPEEVFTPAKLAPLVGATTRDSVRNTLLVLHAKGHIAKVGPGQYQSLRHVLAAETVTTVLDGEDLVRVDALAQERGMPREEMIDTLVASGVAACEGDGAPVTRRRERTDHEDAPLS
jgi:hypothetical protein